MEHCGLHPPTSPEHPLAVHSSSNYFSATGYPAVTEVGVRVNKLGKSSVTYEAALFQKGEEQVKAVNEFIHVFVERETGRPSATGMTDRMRKGLERLLVTSPSKL
jgi:acyl-CoA thioester hydrolase